MEFERKPEGSKSTSAVDDLTDYLARLARPNAPSATVRSDLATKSKNVARALEELRRAFPRGRFRG